MKPRWGLLVGVGLAACGPVDKSLQRPLVTDKTPLGSTRAEVTRWHRANDWCEARRWERSDEFEACQRKGLPGGGLRSYFRYEDGVLQAAAIYTPVHCRNWDGCDRPIGIDTELEGPPFLSITDGLVVNPTEVGPRAAPDRDLPQDQHDMLDGMKAELQERFGPPTWINTHGTGMVWETETESAGLFLSADAHFVVETHQRKTR